MGTYQFGRLVVRTEFVHPPIPDRRWDWCATFDGYEPGEPIGYGPTENAAMLDLVSETEARA